MNGRQAHQQRKRAQNEVRRDIRGKWGSVHPASAILPCTKQQRQLPFDRRLLPCSRTTLNSIQSVWVLDGRKGKGIRATRRRNVRLSVYMYVLWERKKKNGCNDATGDNSERDSRGALISTTPGSGFREAKGFCFHYQRGETNLNVHPNAHKRKSHDDPWAPMPERGRAMGGTLWLLLFSG